MNLIDNWNELVEYSKNDPKFSNELNFIAKQKPNDLFYNSD